MKNEVLFQTAQDTFQKCLNTMAAKNHDYAKDLEDALRNFKAVEFFKLTSAPIGVLVRLSDKFMRICNLVNTEAKVKDEAIEDTIDDMINYLIIFKACLKERKEPKTGGFPHA